MRGEGEGRMFHLSLLIKEGNLSHSSVEKIGTAGGAGVTILVTVSNKTYGS